MIERTVHRLQLSAPREDLIWQGAILLEDALHTASLPEAGRGRVLIIRNLNVGKIRANRSSASIALQIEQHLRWLSAMAVYAETPQAEHSPAVYFRDEVEPYVLLTIRLAQGQPAVEWFWPLAVRDWQPGMPDAIRWTILALTAAHGAAGLTALVRAADEHSVLDQLMAALRPDDGVTLLRTFGWPLAAARDSSLPYSANTEIPKQALALPMSVVPTTRRIASWIARWGASAARSIWLTGVWMLMENPARLVLFQQQPEVLRATTELLYQQQSSAELPYASYQDATAPPTRATVATQSIPISATTPERDLTQWSRAAGLYLVLAVLARLQIGRMLEAHPNLIEAAFPIRLLHHLAAHLGTTADDAARLAIPLPESAQAISEPLPFAAPGLLSMCDRCPLLLRRAPGMRVISDSSGRVVLAAWRGRAPDGVHHLVQNADRPLMRNRTIVQSSDSWSLLLDSWLAATRRWTRRFAQIGLYDLILRPGKVLSTPTHIDVFFDHKQADLRIRRTGLDFDPGWVRWLGRVVTFHYEFLDQ